MVFPAFMIIIMERVPRTRPPFQSLKIELTVSLFPRPQFFLLKIKKPSLRSFSVETKARIEKAEGNTVGETYEVSHCSDLSLPHSSPHCPLALAFPTIW